MKQRRGKGGKKGRGRGEEGKGEGEGQKGRGEKRKDKGEWSTIITQSLM